MSEEQDDLTLVYMFGFRKGQDSMKDEIERLRGALRLLIEWHDDTGAVMLPVLIDVARAALKEKTNG